MKKSLICLCLFAMTLILTSCINLGKPTRNDKEVVKTGYGDEFIIAILKEDQKTMLTVSRDGQGERTVLRFRVEGHNSYMNDYDYENDIVENWTKIISEYQKDNIRAYRFYWGIVYSLDSGVTFSGIAKHEYNYWATQDETIGQIISELGIVLFSGAPYDPDLVVGRSMSSIVEDYGQFDWIVYDDTGGSIREGWYKLEPPRTTMEEKKVFIILFENDIATEAYVRTGDYNGGKGLLHS